MNLAIDIGNSNIKIGSFDRGEMNPTVIETNHSDLNNVVEDLQPARIIVSSVSGSVNNSSFPFVAKYSALILDYKTPVPFDISYETPETLGVDRLAAAAGAQVLNPDGVSMIIDVGTCITYDLLDAESIFQGGIISPGIHLRFKSMNDYTGNLPLISIEEPVPDLQTLGRTTRQAMISGVLNGIKGEMDSLIESYRQLFPDLKVIMCGGDAKFFESSLKEAIFVAPELVLLGLNRILEYNE